MMSTEVANSTKTKTPKPRPNKQRAHIDTRQGPTRKDQLLRQLSRKAGTDVPTMCKTFGWQPHTARAALSTLRKAGHDVVRDPAANGKPARYRVVEAPDHVGKESPITEAPNDAG